MPTNTYDLIVIGDDFAGLVAATLCSQRGMRVLVAHTPGHQIAYQLGPHRLPVRALPFVGMTSPAVRRVIDELHFDHMIKRKLRQHRPAFQIVAPDARIDMVADDEILAHELSRELPLADTALSGSAGAGEISRFLDPVLGEDVTFPPAGFWERREVSRSASHLDDEAEEWFRGVVEDDIARALIELPAAVGTNCDPLNLSAQTRARCFEMWRLGTPRLAGDWQTLNDIFIEKLTSHSGEVRSVECDELTFSWGKATGVRLENGEDLGAEHIIAAMPASELLTLTRSKQPKRLLQCAERLEPGGFRYTLNFLVNEAGIPEGMANTVLVVADPSAPLIGDNALAIYRGEPDDETRVVVTVEAVCAPPNPGDEIDDALADLRVGIRQQLERVMPFFSEHIILAHSPHEAVPAEGSNDKFELEAPLPPHPIWRSSLESYLGVSALPYSIGIKHLSVASSQVLPGLGLEGDFAAGWCAAKLACAAAGKKRDHSKSDLMRR